MKGASAGIGEGGVGVGHFLLARGTNHNNKTMTQEVWVKRPNLSGLSALPRPSHAWTLWKLPSSSLLI